MLKERVVRNEKNEKSQQINGNYQKNEKNPRIEKYSF